jgi:serine-type D-Ala-D-Ala carboxypeptidase/endopeptidase (penicillin-binding protein 4)
MSLRTKCATFVLALLVGAGASMGADLDAGGPIGSDVDAGDIVDEESDETVLPVGAGPPASAGAEQRRAWLNQRVAAALAARPALAKARVGVAAVDLSTREPLVALHADDSFNLASDAKLVTAAAALTRLGPEYRYRTGLYVRAWSPARPDVVLGDLFVRATGDPMLDAGALDQLVDELARLGIRRIEGGLVIDGTWFDDDRLPPAYAQKNEDGYFRAPVAAASLESNAITVRVRPAPGAGKPALVEAVPASEYVVIVNQAVTVRNGRTFVRVSARALPADASGGPRTELTIRGTIRLDAEPQLAKTRVEDPEIYLGETLRTRLAARGIKVKRAGVVMAATPPSAQLLVEHQSPPLAVIVREMGKKSNNFTAEMLIKTMGAEVAGAPGTWAKGLAVAYAYLGEVGIAEGTYRLDNGSGLYDASRMTPRQLVALLAYVHGDFRVFADFIASLSLAGADGTLAKRLAAGPGFRMVRGKTGTLKEVSCLAGYVGGAGSGGRLVAFAVLINDVPPGSSRQARRLQDEIAVALVQYLSVGSEAASGASK